MRAFQERARAACRRRLRRPRPGRRWSRPACRWATGCSTCGRRCCGATTSPSSSACWAASGSTPARSTGSSAPGPPRAADGVPAQRRAHDRRHLRSRHHRRPPPGRRPRRGARPGSTVASLREVEGLRSTRRHVAGLRVAVAEGGGLGALADAVARALTDAGAVVSVLRHPDESALAAAANAFEAEAFLSLAVRDEPGRDLRLLRPGGLRVRRRPAPGAAGGRRPRLATTCAGMRLPGPAGDPHAGGGRRARPAR